ncbi:MAG TPA: hypothetical protein VN874_01410 [Myxococcales bacterium]|jgi:hypothetical protein|nr:hypothetical protein [Myxococcales bacterium]
MLRRVISIVALVALASTPVAARTRLFCRFTGVEITDCPEQVVPCGSVVQAAGCCDRRVAPALPLGAGRITPEQELAPLPLASTAFEASASSDAASRPTALREMNRLGFRIGPPVFLVTRALLL